MKMTLNTFIRKCSNELGFSTIESVLSLFIISMTALMYFGILTSFQQHAKVYLSVSSAAMETIEIQSAITKYVEGRHIVNQNFAVGKISNQRIKLILVLPSYSHAENSPAIDVTCVLMDAAGSRLQILEAVFMPGESRIRCGTQKLFEIFGVKLETRKIAALPASIAIELDRSGDHHEYYLQAIQLIARIEPDGRQFGATLYGKI